jgi:hypothetical protein
MLLKNTLPIVLTATIYPRAIMTVHLTASERRLEYLNAVKYYTKFSHVYLLENSGFNFKDDLDFCSCENVTYIQLEPSNEFNKGKGFQEFEMLDNWFKLLQTFLRMLAFQILLIVFLRERKAILILR